MDKNNNTPNNPNNKNNGITPRPRIDIYDGGATKPIPKLEDLKDLTSNIEDGEYEELDEFYEDEQEINRYEPMITRRRDKSTGLVGGLLYFLFVLGVSVILACLIWMAATDVIALGKEEREATIEIAALPYDREALVKRLETAAKDKELDIFVPANASVEEVLSLFTANGLKRPAAPFDLDVLTADLHDNEIINYEWLFKLFVKFSHSQDKIEPGVYELNATLDYHAIISSLKRTSKSRPVIEGVTIPEGYTVAQIFTLLEEKRICNADELWDAAANYDFDYSFIKELPKGDKNRLEGFLFPDTYDFFLGSYPQEAIKKFLANFNLKYNTDLRRATEEQGKTIKEILTVASLIEREAANDAERPTIASVIYNRLNNWSNPLLQIDASIQYALPEHVGRITAAELAVDSPYNTYKYPGLPPGPIANPGITSIKAALNPDKTEYYFYALNKEYLHNFFKTDTEHAAFVAGPDFVNN